MAIQFRPHHFLCALCFQGAGYSPSFIQNFTQIMQRLAADETTAIEIVPHTDSICAPCPHRQNLHCDSQEKIDRLDQAHANALQIETHTLITWQDAKKQIKQHLTLEQFHSMCEPCEWKKFGICETILTKFLNE